MPTHLEQRILTTNKPDTTDTNTSIQTNRQHLPFRIGMLLIGTAAASFGIALTTLSGLGTTPISSVPWTLTVSGLSVYFHRTDGKYNPSFSPPLRKRQRAICYQAEFMELRIRQGRQVPNLSEPHTRYPPSLRQRPHLCRMRRRMYMHLCRSSAHTNG